MIYKSCRLLEHGIYFYLDPGTQHLIAGHCCNTDNLDFNDRLYMYFDLKNEKLDWNYIFNEKKKLRENAKKGIYPSQCDGCFELKEQNWDEEDYINHLTAGHIMKCNSRCTYCPTGRIPEWHNKEQDIDIKPVIKELTDNNLLRFDGSLRFVGGEPTLMKEFDWLVDLFSKHNVPEIYVPTSAIRFSKSLCNTLSKIESAAVVISVDSGTKETFEKVKGTKFYDIVWNNIKTYLNSAREKSFVISKFILYTNNNDSAFEIEQWLKKCKETGIVEVQFDAEHSVSSSENCENKKFVNRTLKMLNFAEKEAKKYNIKVFSFLAFMNRAKRIYAQKSDFYNQNKDNFSDLYINNDNKNINFDGLYKNLYFDIDSVNTDFILNTIDKLAVEEKLAPERIAYINSKTEITKNNNFEKIVMFLLRLGYDIEFITSASEYNKIIDEILKTSNSVITFDVKSNAAFAKLIPFYKLFKIQRIKNNYKNGNIIIK